MVDLSFANQFWDINERKKRHLDFFHWIGHWVLDLRILAFREGEGKGDI